jgi:glutathione S-transferase
LIALHEKGLFARTDLRLVDPWADAPALLADAPVGKVPALVTDDGLTLSESTTICDYLDSLPGAGPSLIGADRWQVMARVALAQGVIDAGFSTMLEKRRPAGMQSPAAAERHKRALLRTIGAARAQAGRFDLGDISLAAGLGYADFRLPEIDWRAARPDLADWFDKVSERPSMTATKPA